MKKQRPVQITIRLHQDNEKEMRALQALQDAQQEGKTYAEILTDLLETQGETENNAPALVEIQEPKKPEEPEEAGITEADVSRIVAEALKAAGVGSGGSTADLSGEKKPEPKPETGRRFRPELYPEGVWPPIGTPEYQEVMNYRLNKLSQDCDRLLSSQLKVLHQGRKIIEDM